uniref:Si:ch211-209f23.6 n=1 Tax=Sinocyclocheilus anshuiensis TaxID=1608454 RepID=A0A671KUF3_9TELE
KSINILFALFIISVFVQTGASVQLDIQTQELPEFDDLYWKNDKSENIVKYTSESKKEKRYSSYKDRMDFNNKTFSLTLKNMQKTDSGLYTAIVAAESDNNIVTYRVSVIDAVEAPVLTVNSSGSSDSCTVSFTCRGHDFTLSSTFVYGSCSREEVTSQINTLILFCSVEAIICNHSNPVSWKEDRINITQLCEENEITQMTTNSYGSSYMTGLIIVFGIVGVILFAGLILYCYCKNKKGMSIS